MAGPVPPGPHGGCAYECVFPTGVTTARAPSPVDVDALFLAAGRVHGGGIANAGVSSIDSRGSDSLPPLPPRRVPPPTPMLLSVGEITFTTVATAITEAVDIIKLPLDIMEKKRFIF